MATSYSRLARSYRLGGIAALTLSAALLLPVSDANATAKPSATAVRKELDKLNGQVDQLANRYNKGKTQLDAAKKHLAAINKETVTEKSQYQDLRVRVAQITIAAYKNGTLDSTSFAASKDPNAALEEMSAFTELSSSRSQELNALLASAQRLHLEQEEAQTTLQTVTSLTTSLKKQKATVEKAIAKQKTLLPKISNPGGNTNSGGGSSNSAAGSASGAVRKAVSYAYAQLTKPYIFGGTGPTGFDCSGLTMMAWRAAGVDLPRVVPDQYNAIRHVAKSDLQPGDLVFFDSLGHEGIYVGGGRFIHAPHTGTDVQFASMSNPYWAANYVGAGRP